MYETAVAQLLAVLAKGKQAQQITEAAKAVAIKAQDVLAGGK